MVERSRPRSNKGLEMESKRRGSLIGQSYEHPLMIPSSYPTTMKDRLSMVIVEQKEEGDKMKKFVTELMNRDPHIRMS